MKKFTCYQDVMIYANPRGRDEAAFRRFKKGEKELYTVVWVSWGGDIVEARRKRGGRLDKHTYVFSDTEVIPVKIFQKNLEDYL